MQTRRGIMAGLWAIGLVAIAAIAVVMIARPGLPPPAEANRQQLLYWLVTRDLSLETDATRLALVRRLEQESLKGFSWKSCADDVDLSYRAMLWKNVSYLVEPWLKDKADGYFRLPEDERTAYLDGLIDLIQIWRGLDALAQRPRAAESDNSSQFLGLLLTQISATIERADAEEAQRLTQFVMATELRWLTRSVRGR